MRSRAGWLQAVPRGRIDAVGREGTSEAKCSVYPDVLVSTLKQPNPGNDHGLRSEAAQGNRRLHITTNGISI